MAQKKKDGLDAFASFITDLAEIVADGSVKDRTMHFDSVRNRIEVVETFTSGRTRVRYYVPEN